MTIDGLITVALVVLIVVVWERRDERRGIDEAHAARQGDFGWRLITLLLAGLAVLTVALVLEGLGVPGAAAIAAAAIVALLLVFYVLPFFGPRP